MVKIIITLTITIVAFIIPYKLFMGYVNYLVPTIANNVHTDGNYSTSVEFNTVTESSQFSRLVMNRGVLLFHENDYDDSYDAETRAAYLAAYNNIVKNNPNGILEKKAIDWTVKPDVQGLFFERNVDNAISGLSEYYEALFPEKTDVEIWSIVRSRLVNFSIMAFIKHPILAIELFCRLFYAGLQAAIFFQPDGLYVVSEILAGMLLLFTILLLIVNRQKGSNAYYVLVVATTAVLVYAGIVSAVHQPLQRYLVYFQGVFMIGIFLDAMEFLSGKYVWIARIFKNVDDAK